MPLSFQKKPTHRLIAPGLRPSISMIIRWHALNTRYDYGVTALYSLIAGTITQCLGVNRQLHIWTA